MNLAETIVADYWTKEMTEQLVAMSRALLRARGESTITIRLITHAVEQCAELVGSDHFNSIIKKDRAIDAAIYGIFEGDA